VEENETVQVVLEVPSGGGSVAAQFRTNVTIVDDDGLKLAAKLTYASPNSTRVVADAAFSTTVYSVKANGDSMLIGGERFFALVENDANKWIQPGIQNILITLLTCIVSKI